MIDLPTLSPGGLTDADITAIRSAFSQLQAEHHEVAGALVRYEAALTTLVVLLIACFAGLVGVWLRLRSLRFSLIADMDALVTSALSALYDRAAEAGRHRGRRDDG